MRTLDVQLEEIPDWNCCGATSAHVMTENLALALPMRNLVLAEKLECKTMGIACASCYSRMKSTKKHLDENPELAERYRIESIPNLLVFRGSQLTGQHSGLADKALLRRLLRQ